MFISAVYIRFFRLFNFDYLRKAHRDFAPEPWDVLEPDGLQYPFVRVPLERSSAFGCWESLALHRSL
ncbi:hypothetical protein [Micromonospora marina]|uniref:hypothetical protein n=1 Tax=Micromonospora marina TaxID=307120 RepID=UPI003D745FA9